MVVVARGGVRLLGTVPGFAPGPAPAGAYGRSVLPSTGRSRTRMRRSPPRICSQGYGSGGWAVSSTIHLTN